MKFPLLPLLIDPLAITGTMIARSAGGKAAVPHCSPRAIRLHGYGWFLSRCV